MDSSLAVEATNLSKKYRLGTIGMTSLREDISRWWGRNKQSSSIEKNTKTAGIDQSRMINESEFWALHDLNFQIPKGEVVGLIGANGSGKSTLLKILSRITEPTQGEVKIRGKVASLLEVGTGFHPELTGRENVYINGAILGMTRREVGAKFDEIVEFAGVSDFIDTPIKRYSSGMTVRLGFAVAAHLEPDILIVDEVLAVGDASFQKKCIGKMEDISNEGRTIIFVSHNLSSVEALCTTSYLLDSGTIQSVGSTSTIISNYLLNVNKNIHINDLNNKQREGSGEIRVTSIKMLNAKKKNVSQISCGEKVLLEFKFENYEICNFIPAFAVSVKNYKEMNISWLNSKLVGQEVNIFKTGCITFEINNLSLVPGTYFLNSFIGNYDKPVDWIINAFKFEVCTGSFYETGSLPPESQAVFLSDFRVI
jgi:lipopolysaccharide transport system ATP-binding protein